MMRKAVLSLFFSLILLAGAEAAGQSIHFGGLRFTALKPNEMKFVVGLPSGDQVTTWTTDAMEYSYVYSINHKDCGFGVIYTVNRDCSFEELESLTTSSLPPTTRIKSSGFRKNAKGAKYFYVEMEDTANHGLSDQAIFDSDIINKFIIFSNIFPGTNFTPRTMCPDAVGARKVNFRHWKNLIASVALDKPGSGQ